MIPKAKQALGRERKNVSSESEVPDLRQKQFDQVLEFPPTSYQITYSTRLSFLPRKQQGVRGLEEGLGLGLAG